MPRENEIILHRFLYEVIVKTKGHTFHQGLPLTFPVVQVQLQDMMFS